MPPPECEGSRNGRRIQLLRAVGERHARGLPARVMDVFSAILSKADEGGHWEGVAQEIADYCNLSSCTPVFAALEALEGAGLLAIDRSQRPNGYDLPKLEDVLRTGHEPYQRRRYGEGLRTRQQAPQSGVNRHGLTRKRLQQTGEQTPQEVSIDSTKSGDRHQTVESASLSDDRIDGSTDGAPVAPSARRARPAPAPPAPILPSPENPNLGPWHQLRAQASEMGLSLAEAAVRAVTLGQATEGSRTRYLDACGAQLWPGRWPAEAAHRLPSILRAGCPAGELMAQLWRADLPPIRDDLLDYLVVCARNAAAAAARPPVAKRARRPAPAAPEPEPEPPADIEEVEEVELPAPEPEPELEWTPMIGAATIWQRVLGELRASTTRSAFDTWVAGTSLLGRLPDGTWVVGAPSAFAREWLETRFMDRLVPALAAQIGSEVRVVLRQWPRKRSTLPPLPLPVRVKGQGDADAGPPTVAADGGS